MKYAGFFRTLDEPRSDLWYSPSLPLVKVETEPLRAPFRLIDIGFCA